LFQLLFHAIDCLFLALNSGKLTLQLFDLAGLLTEFALPFDGIVLGLFKLETQLNNLISSVLRDHRQVLSSVFHSSVDIVRISIHFVARF